MLRLNFGSLSLQEAFRKPSGSLSLSEEHMGFLKRLVEIGEADSLSQAMRKCISIAMEKFEKGSGK